MKFEALSVSPEDAQFLEGRKFSRSEIAGLWRIPAHMVNDLDKSSFNNMEEQSRNFVDFTIMPIVVNWEQEINTKLITMPARERGVKVEFLLDSLLRGNAKTRGEYYMKQMQSAAISPNEIRVLENRNPYEGGDDKYIPVNLQKVS
jgi:HK97 family phage portal protein